MDKKEKNCLIENDLFESYKRFKEIVNINEYSFASNGKDLLLDEDEENTDMDVKDETPIEEPSSEKEVSVDNLDSIPDETSDNTESSIENEIGGNNAEEPEITEPTIEEPIEQPSEVENEDDVVVDVTDLTKSSEETEQKIIDLDNKLDDMLNQLSLKVDTVLNKSSQAMEDLKKEMERRNPTNIEKLQMRTTQNYPFSTTPDQYWEKKEKEGVYDTKPEEKEYVLKTSDVDTNMSNNQFRQSLYTEELEYSTKLSDLL